MTETKYPFTLEYNPKLDPRIERYFRKAYDINRKFFKSELEPFTVRFWYSRELFNKHFKLPSESKYHANSGMKATDPMDFVSSSVLKPEGRMLPPKEYQKLVTHEFCHRFYFQKYGAYPAWLAEGFAIFVAGNDFENDQEFIPLSKIHKTADWIKNNNYWQAASMTKFLIEKYGMKKLEELLEHLGKADNYQKFSGKFRGIYGFSPEEFEKIWKDSLK